MEFKVLSEQDKKQFDAFVSSNESGSFLQSWDWGQWQEFLGKKVVRAVVSDDGGRIVLSASFIRTPIGKKYYLYAPYGPVLANELTEHTEPVKNFFLSALKTHFPDALFFRFEPKALFLSSAELKPTVNIQPAQTLVLDLAQTDEALLEKMHPKTRYNIKVALKHEVVVRAEPVAVPQHGLYLAESVDLIVQTAKRQNFKTYPATYYKKLIDFFGRTAKDSNLKVEIYQALHQGHLLASALMVDFGSTRTYLFGGSSMEQKNVMAPYLLHWQAIQDARRRGLSHYDFWGLETATGKQAGFVRFKQGFGGQIKKYAGAKDLVQKGAWYNTYKILRNINRIKNKFS